MPAKAVIELGDQATAIRLFTYPNDGHADQSLKETIEHYFNDSVRREGQTVFQVRADIAADRCAVTITVNEETVAKEIAARYQLFFDNGNTGLQDADAFRASGKWDGKWKFLLPLGVPMAFARAIEIMDFPPSHAYQESGLPEIQDHEPLVGASDSEWCHRRGEGALQLHT